MKDTCWNKHGPVGGTLLDNWVEERAVGSEVILLERDLPFLSRNGHIGILEHQVTTSPKKEKPIVVNRPVSKVRAIKEREYSNAAKDVMNKLKSSETSIPIPTLEHPDIYRSLAMESYTKDFISNSPLNTDFKAEDSGAPITFWSHMHKKGAHTVYSSSLKKTDPSPTMHEARKRIKGMQAVMSDPNLRRSLQTLAESERPEEFETLARRLHFQLAVGCGQDCTSSFCKSNPRTPRLTPDAAAAIALHLASRKCTQYLCKKCPEVPNKAAIAQPQRFTPAPRRKMLPNTVVKTATDPGTPFLCSFFSTVPFQNIFRRELPIHRSISMQLLFDRTPSVAELLPTEEIEEEPTMVLSHLTYELLVQTLSTIQQGLSISSLEMNQENNEDDMFLEESILHVFSSETALMRSFRGPGGLDAESIAPSFELILGLEPTKRYRKILRDAIEIKMSQFVGPRYFESKEKLSQILILFENPLLDEKQYFESLLRPLLVAVAKLNSSAKAVIVSWLTLYSEQMLRKIVNRIQAYIKGKINPSFRADDACISAVRCLGLCYSANEKSNKLGYTEFYNSSLSGAISFKEEYKVWRMVMSSKYAQTFSFFSYPFLFDPIAKTRIVHIDAMVQMTHEYEDACVSQALVMHTQKMLVTDSDAANQLEDVFKDVTNPYLVLELSRSQLLRDTMHQIYEKKKDLKKPLKVRFINEDGMDQGGVQKEFFQEIMTNLSDPSFGLFIYDPQTRFLWINGRSEEPLRHFELAGIIIGLAVYNGVMLSLRFANIMYKKLLNERVKFTDAKEMWPDLTNGLTKLLEWTEGDVSDTFGQTFEVSVTKTVTRELMEHGAQVVVTNANRQQYVDLYIEWIANGSVAEQFDAFRRGFQHVCGGPALKMLRAEELELLLCGEEVDIDLKKLEESAGYDDGYSATHRAIIDFWQIVRDMDTRQQKKLLEFVTASDRVPLKGMGSLTFVVQRNGPDCERLPTALTCFGRLLLPEYSTREKMRRFMLMAVENAKGFGLV